MKNEKDILEALKKCCDPDNDCRECPYRKMHAGCDVLEQDALDLIIKLQKENESLKAELTAAQQAKMRAKVCGMNDETLKTLGTLDDKQIDIVIKYFHAHCGSEDMSAREQQEAYGRFTTMLHKELNPHQREALARFIKGIHIHLEQIEGDLYKKATQTILQAKKEYVE